MYVTLRAYSRAGMMGGAPHQEKVLHVDMGFFQNYMLGKKLHVDMGTEDTVRPLIKRGEHEETPGFQNFAVFCPLCIVRGTGVCRTHIEVGYLVVARGTGWG